MSSVTVKLDYTVATSKSFDQAVEAVNNAVANAGFRVLHTHDVQGTFREKGVEIAPYKIVEVCNVKYAKQALAKDLLIGLMMPCKINVYTQKDQTKISLMLPTVMSVLAPGLGMEPLAEEVEGILRGVVDAAK
ncbi:MAG: DUF302 domain-containing protein [Chloroflexi bacterium]|nr:DUF302 domain-containing protein [Chloroflexota bacterium]MDA8187253.1 DUF302 domain-containing protein [Dehalococcoidales bacterium]